MYCNQCGAEIGANDAVCPSCGRSAIGGRVEVQARVRVAEQLHLVGILWFVVAGLAVLPAIVMLALSGAIPRMAGPDEATRAFGPVLFLGLSVVSFGFALACFAAGYGLVKIAPWGRTMALIMGFLSLPLFMPFGTALGVYTLYVLLPTAAGDEYTRLAQASEAQKLRVVTSQGA